MNHRSGVVIKRLQDIGIEVEVQLIEKSQVLCVIDHPGEEAGDNQPELSDRRRTSELSIDISR